MPQPSKAEREVLAMFGPDGNWEDFWLGTPRFTRWGTTGTNSFMGPDQRGWVSAEEVLRGPVEDGPEDETLFLMRAPGKPEGGGIVGLDEEYSPVLTGILRAGERALDEERQLRRRKAIR